MKRTIILILIATLMLSLSLPAWAEDAPTVTVTGNATVSLMADTATIWIGASTRKDSVAQAQSENDSIMTAVLAALLKAGIPQEDIATSMYDINVIQPDPYGSWAKDNPQYEVSNVLFVTIRDLNVLSAAIDAASTAGANNIYGLSFASSKNQEAYDRALERAVEDAARKAHVLAKATGKELGDVVSIGNEQLYGGAYGIMNSMDMMSRKESGAVIVSGDVSVSANITITYKLKW